MSVYIKGIEMPKNCDDCLLGSDCPYDQSIDGYKMQGGRPRTCPLVPVPPHGRLIDADALIAWFKEWYDLNADVEVWQMIQMLADEQVAPTIIPADKEESE